jgi:hypothetical protein
MYSRFNYYVAAEVTGEKQDKKYRRVMPTYVAFNAIHQIEELNSKLSVILDEMWPVNFCN